MRPREETPTDEASRAPLLAGERLAQLTASLVSIPSVNGVDPELAVVEAVEHRLRQTDLELTRVTLIPGRPSLAAVLHGRERGHDTLVLNAHTDTVGVDDAQCWSVDPFGGEVRDGWIHGRGSVDMKGAIAIQIALAQFFSTRPRRLRGSLVLHFAMGEERGEPGTLSLLEAGFDGRFGIALEPTRLEIAIAQRGVVSLRLRLLGVSAHTSMRERGKNPIDLLPGVLAALYRYDAELARTPHPLLGPATCTPTILAAGTIASAIPPWCDLVIDRRLLPGESPSAALQEVRETVGGVLPQDRFQVSVETEEGIFEPAEIPQAAELVQRLSGVVTAAAGRAPALIGTPYASDVRHLIAHGIEAVTFGPGDIARAHAVDERLEVVELEAAARCLAALGLDLLA